MMNVSTNAIPVPERRMGIKITRHLWCDRDGWPVTSFKGRPITNVLRLLFLARRRRKVSAVVYFDIASEPSGASVMVAEAERLGLTDTPASEPPCSAEPPLSPLKATGDRSKHRILLRQQAEAEASGDTAPEGPTDERCLFCKRKRDDPVEWTCRSNFHDTSASEPTGTGAASEDGHARWQDWPDNRLIHIQDEIHELRATATGVLATTCEVAIELIDLVFNTRFDASQHRAESDARVVEAVREACAEIATRLEEYDSRFGGLVRPQDRLVSTILTGIGELVTAIADDPIRLANEPRGDAGRAACYDCRRPYGEGGFHDLVVPDDVWKRISPTGDEGGLLCPCCMIARCVKLGIECEAAFTSGPFTSQPPWRTPTGAASEEGNDGDDRTSDRRDPSSNRTSDAFQTLLADLGLPEDQQEIIKFALDTESDARAAKAVRDALIQALDGFGGCEGESEWYVCINEGGDVREYESAKDAVRGVFDYGFELGQIEQMKADTRLAAAIRAQKGKGPGESTK